VYIYIIVVWSVRSDGPYCTEPVNKNGKKRERVTHRERKTLRPSVVLIKLHSPPSGTSGQERGGPRSAIFISRKAELYRDEDAGGKKIRVIESKSISCYGVVFGTCFLLLFIQSSYSGPTFFHYFRTSPLHPSLPPHNHSRPFFVQFSCFPTDVAAKSSTLLIALRGRYQVFSIYLYIYV